MSSNCPKLLDFIAKNNTESDENKKLELRLGLPGDNDGWYDKITLKNTPSREINESILSLNFLNHNNHPWPNTAFASTSPFHPTLSKESSQPCCTSIVDLQEAEKKGFSPTASVNTAVPNSAQKRSAPAPVVGWPPIRSFRKNLASTSTTKPVLGSQDTIVIPSKTVGENTQKGLFVKINMDGVPIGRKVDLNAYDSYSKLSSAVDELFRGLLAAQRDSSGETMDAKQEEQKAITGLLDESGEYTLVYEDNEGDRMLVGDVPWHMFVCTVKRLRVLKSSDLPTLSRVNNDRGKVLIERASN